MRGWAILAALLLPGIPLLAAAAVETVTVEGQKDLTGIWKFPPMEQAVMWSSARASFYDMGREMYCRIGEAEPDFVFNCFDTAPFGHATLDEYGHVQIGWQAQSMGTGDLTGDHFVFNGTLQSKTALSGNLGAVHDGFRGEAPERMTVTKVGLSEKTPDLGGQKIFLARLLDEMVSGAVLEPHDPPSRQVSLLTPDDLHPLGKTLSVIYIAEYTPKTGFKNGVAQYSDETASIYDVEFEKGERLCALHRRPDGVLDYFRCI